MAPPDVGYSECWEVVGEIKKEPTCLLALLYLEKLLLTKSRDNKCGLVLFQITIQLLPLLI